MSRRILLLMPTTSYKSGEFLEAAGRLGVEVVVGTERKQALEDAASGHTLVIDLTRPSRSVSEILRHHALRPFDAVLGVDDETIVMAAMAARALGLPHNPEASVRASRDKYETRRRLEQAGLRCPGFRKVALERPPEEAARLVAYPSVLKPLSLSAGRGVIRADDPAGFVEAFRRIEAILRGADVERNHGRAEHLLVEDYIPGGEVALEGLLEDGRLRELALFDKPDPMVGPTFEETLYVTPSRLPVETRSAILREAAAGCAALGLREGPVHAELRVGDDGPWLLEVAARTIGGLCSRALRFGAGISLEELVLRHALGLETETLPRRDEAAGVMMIPIPRAGVLREVGGLDAARAVPRIEEITLTVHRGASLLPLPEGHRYLGFIFARAEKPEQVERALRDAHALLRFTIEEHGGHGGGNGVRS